MNQRKKICLKIVFVVSISVIMAFLLEVFWFNKNAIFKETFWHNYKINSEKYTNVRIDDESVDRIVSITFENPTFINKVFIEAVENKDIPYGIWILYENNFGVLEEDVLNDSILASFGIGVSRIDKSVKEIAVVYSEEYSGDVSTISIKNEVDINKYRWLFWTVCIGLICSIGIFSELLQSKLELFFAIAALSLGGMIIVYSGSSFSCWDEPFHYRNVLGWSYDEEEIVSEADFIIMSYESPAFNSKEEKEMAISYLNKKDETLIKQRKVTEFIQYNYRSYYIRGLALKVGRFLGMNFNQLYMWGKFCGLFIYIGVIYIAIKKAVIGKLAIGVLSLLPTPLFIASSYSYDSDVFCFLVLAVVLIINEYVEFAKEIDVKRISCILFVTIWGCFSKMIYAPVILLLLLFPKSKFVNGKQRCIFTIGVILIFFVMMSTFVLPAITNTVISNNDFMGDIRGGNTSLAMQMKSILLHPVEYIKILLKSIMSLENFRNLGTVEGDGFSILVLMLLNYSVLGCMNEKYLVLLIPLLAFVMWVRNEGTEYICLPTYIKRIIAIIIFSIVCLIWTALYLSFTPVGESRIQGVQARYYLPLVYPLGILCYNNKLKIACSVVRQNQIIMGVVILIELIGIYNNMFINLCA